MPSRFLLVQAPAVGAGRTSTADLAVYLLAALVLAAAIAAAILLGRRVRADARRGLAGETAPEGGPSELTSRHVFRVLQERKIASVEQIAAMSPRERQLLFDAVARKVTPVVGVPAVGAAGATPPSPPAVADEAPIGTVHCPACGAALQSSAGATRLVTQCAGCGRRVAARREAGRVSVTVDDRRDSGSVQATPRPPQRPSGGSPTTRARS